jgi:hypothetical protein
VDNFFVKFFKATQARSRLAEYALANLTRDTSELPVVFLAVVIQAEADMSRKFVETYPAKLLLACHAIVAQ